MEKMEKWVELDTEGVETEAETERGGQSEDGKDGSLRKKNNIPTLCWVG